MNRFVVLSLAALCACSGPSPAAVVSGALELGTLVSPSGVVGRDGAATAPLWGEDVWIFGDTFLSVTNVEGMTFVSNTYSTSVLGVDGGIMLAQPVDDAGAPSELLWPTSDELAYDVAHETYPDGGCGQAPCGGRYATWPGATVIDPDGGEALIFYGLVSAAPGNFNFSGIGTGIAVWTGPDVPPVRPEPGVCDGGPPTALFCADEPGWGEGAALVDGGLYTFACQESWLSDPCQLARVPIDQALQKGAWRYWDGSSWSSNFAAAANLFDGAPILSFYFNDHVGQWMAVYSEPFSNRVAFRTAPDLTGPWSGEGTLFVADMSDAGGTAYDAYVHPELSEQGGRIQYVTYSRSNGTTFGDEFVLWQVTFQ